MPQKLFLQLKKYNQIIMLISVSKIVLTILDKTDIINDTNKYASKMKDRKSNIFIESRHGLVENFGPRVLEIKEIDG